MGFLFHTKLIPELDVITVLKRFDPEPDLCPLNIKLSALILKFSYLKNAHLV